MDDTDEREDGERQAIIDKLEAGLPGKSMGLRPGDRLISINGHEVNYGLAGAMVRSLPGGVPIRVQRSSGMAALSILRGAPVHSTATTHCA